ncbi:MAG TPA: hypothetical protein VEB19_08080 [Gemmatimonadaceae bacterium]|nr:hypothetical protein [Gemmatimonadaceae bacterium]
MRQLVFTAAMLVVSAVPAAAQFPERVQPGVRVRVWLPEAQLQQEDSPWHRQRLRATVGDVVSDTLRLVVPGASGSLSVARADIRRLDISRGTSRVASAFERAAGFAIAGAISAAIENDPGSSEWPNYRTTWRAAGEGAKWGAAFGAVLGFVLPTERWRRVSLRR